MKISHSNESPCLGRPFRDLYVSETKQNVFRGLHYQIEPFSQEKYFSCIEREVIMFCVFVNSPDKIIQFVLTPASQASLYVPMGWATGFYAKSSSNKLLYASHQQYSPEHEAGLHFGILPIRENTKILVSQKDQLW